MQLGISRLAPPIAGVAASTLHTDFNLLPEGPAGGRSVRVFKCGPGFVTG
jgi:hypothetical protein